MEPWWSSRAGRCPSPERDAATVTAVDATEVNRQVEGAAAAHQRLLSALHPVDGPGLTDEMVARPSRLPEWTVGHVLAHLALNAVGLTRMFDAAEHGEVGLQYPGGLVERAADIERFSGRTADEHVSALRSAIYELEGAWNRARVGWTGSGQIGTGLIVPIADVPLRRWREVEVHMSDLGLRELSLDGHDIWSGDYVRHDLRRLTMQYNSRASMGLAGLPAPVMALSPAARLAWLVGRLEVDGVAPAGVL